MTTYDEFTRRMIDKFKIRDPKISFRELAHVKKTGTHEAYISEYQKLVVMVIDIS